MLADLLLYVHFGFVAFVVLGAAAIIVGKLRGWSWTGNRVWRRIHLAAVLFVAVEAVIGMACPLTVWEQQLRGAEPGGPGLIAGLVSSLLYYDWPAWVFTILYIAFAVLVALLYRWAPPHAGTNRLGTRS